MRERERESNKTDPHTHTHTAERKCGDGDCGGEKTFSLLLPPLVSRPGPVSASLFNNRAHADNKHLINDTVRQLPKATL